MLLGQNVIRLVSLAACALLCSAVRSFFIRVAFYLFSKLSLKWLVRVWARALHLCIVYQSSKLECFQKRDKHSTLNRLDGDRNWQKTDVANTYCQNVLYVFLCWCVCALFSSHQLEKLAENECSFTHEMVLNQPRYHFTSFFEITHKISVCHLKCTKVARFCCSLHVSTHFMR